MEKVYENFNVLVNDIREHIKKNPDAEIILKDNPFKLRIGYYDTKNDVWWQIRLVELKKDSSLMSIRRNFSSEEGKKEILNSILNG